MSNIDQNKAFANTEKYLLWSNALNELHNKQMAVVEAEREAAAFVAALDEARKAVDALLPKWAAAEARAEAARQALKA